LAPRSKLPLHVVLLTNIISPHQERLYEELSQCVDKLTVLVSASAEPGKWPDWRSDWGSLNVCLQRSTTLHRPWHHPAGFVDSTYVHVPWDTIPLLWRLRPDVVISSELGCRTLLSALYTCLARRTPLIIWAALSEQTERGRGWLRHVLRRWLVRLANCLIVNGASGERYVRSLGYRSANVFYVPYASLPGVFDQNSVFRGPQRAHHLLYVGQLSGRKGILPFTHALARWAQLHPQGYVGFSLVGTGPLEDQIRSVPTPPNLSLRLLGECNYRQIAAHYAEAGILVLPTLADEWGLVVNEAMSAGLPVLGSRYSQAVEELCVEGVTGWTFRPDATDEIMRALDRAFNTPVSRLNEMRVVARRKVRPLHPRNTATRLVQAIQTALDAAARPAMGGVRRYHTRPSRGRAFACPPDGWEGHLRCPPDGSGRRPGGHACRVRAGGLVRTFPGAYGGVPEESAVCRLVAHLGLRGAAHLGVGLHKLLGSRTRFGVGILAYHRVAPLEPGLRQPPDHVTPGQFREHITGLLARGFVFWPLRKVLHFGADGAPIAPQTVVVTFDDGYEGVYAHAFPILQQFRVPATVFASTAYLDEPVFPFDSWGQAHRDRVPAEVYRPLTTAQCLQMIRSGLVELGLHTHTHQDFRHRAEEFGEDLRASAGILLSRFGQRKPMFAFPYGQSHRGFTSDELVAVAKQAGTICGLTLDPVVADPRSDPFRWGRFNVFPWDNSATLAAKLSGWYSWTARLRRATSRFLHSATANGPPDCSGATQVE
jgi:glycosyltransferase involved in cell wall biosynthesis/peptidoglycan/xylan/chitin deacetylase (PgdA/CDA1 family)